MINFAAIKTEIIAKGYAYAEPTEAATQTVIIVEGQWNRDGSARITKTAAGWIVGDFPKALPVTIDVPKVALRDDSAIRSELAAAYPGTKIIVKIS